jgi:hypothetical protein
MELALNLGMTSETMQRAMSEREFVSWQRYAAAHMLPLRRIEVYLAQIAMMIVKTMSSSAGSLTLGDFLLKPQEEVSDENKDRIQVAREAFGFKPRPKRTET